MCIHSSHAPLHKIYDTSALWDRLICTFFFYSFQYLSHNGFQSPVMVFFFLQWLRTGLHSSITELNPQTRPHCKKTKWSGDGWFVVTAARHCIYQESSGLHISREAPTWWFRSKQDRNWVSTIKKQPHCHLSPATLLLCSPQELFWHAVAPLLPHKKK